MEEYAKRLAVLSSKIEELIVGKQKEIRLILVAFFARGHVLIEDMPGMGKTSLAKAMAQVFDLNFQRIQGSTDLLPSDILGVNIFNPKTNEFEFREGPVFSEILLFDEMNRTPPKTQSALLQVMAEKQVTIDQMTLSLDPPFFVIGTQNPASSEGTYKLPDSQLDRFSIRLSLGYPGVEFEKRILMGEIQNISSLGLAREEILKLQDEADKVFVKEEIIDYVLELVEQTRNDGRLIHGVSVRGSQEIIALGRVLAMFEGRDYVVPEDIKFLAPYVFSHRLLSYELADRVSQERYIQKLLDETRIPM